MAIHFILIVGRACALANYQAAVSAAGYIPVTTDSLQLLQTDTEADVLSHHHMLSRMDLLLLPGGGDIAPDLLHMPDNGFCNIDRSLDLVQFAYFDYFLSHQKPVLGICKGMQLINAALGGTLTPDMPHALQDAHACHQQLLTDASATCDNRHSCRYLSPADLADIAVDFPMLPIYRQLYESGQLPTQINSAHHQCIEHPADVLCPFQYAPDDVIEGFIHHLLPIIGLQWHPERLVCTDGNYLKLFLNVLLSSSIKS
jgi:putative glutamine amidotransferase